HVLAYAVRDVSIDVLAGTTAATTLRSPFQREPASDPLSLVLPEVGTVTDLSSDSRQVQITPGQPLQIRITGQGCAMLVSALKPWFARRAPGITWSVHRPAHGSAEREPVGVLVRPRAS